MALVLLSAPKFCHLPQKCLVWLWHMGRDSNMLNHEMLIFTLFAAQRFLPHSLYCLT